MFGMRSWPSPYFKFMGPFITAGVVVLYGVTKLQRAVSSIDEHRDNPQNPYYAEFQAQKHKSEH
ncbi:hypothetical protein BB559_005343 [Furculomyces boomerangus]|uniref:ATP synthase subunit J, mitochondrial n=2 Tax=Harpellales TaxID=61421 RepID=A0A2T9Y7A9_9FUNG|nr:hypothetical protein BB559_005675 [Furculomyces boomerangus]PVU88892.1 hypothetical protein BB559_005343 [Furculomyces boomerangus]PWA02984.1 hypothetical protein BB558_000855 [Smittium angustum]